jgi:hypothetical protein
MRITRRGDHSSSPGIATGIQQPTRGFSIRSSLRHRQRSASSLENAVQRAGPALPSYLALHHAGFSVPPVSPPERWALTPPFHPCQAELAFRRRLAGFPVRCHRAPLRRRSILCGTFRDAVVAATLRRRSNLVPWRYQARCPCRKFRWPFRSRLSASANGQRASQRCPDFPPASAL